MDATTLWLVVGVILLVAVVLVGFVAVGRRRAQRTPEQPPSLEKRPAQGRDRPDGRSRPRILGMAPPPPGLTLRRHHHADVEVPDIELVPEAPEFEQPEAPESRLIRLRRRLAGSNSPPQPRPAVADHS